LQAKTCGIRRRPGMRARPPSHDDRVFARGWMPERSSVSAGAASGLSRGLPTSTLASVQVVSPDSTARGWENARSAHACLCVPDQAALRLVIATGSGRSAPRSRRPLMKSRGLLFAGIARAQALAPKPSIRLERELGQDDVRALGVTRTAVVYGPRKEADVVGGRKMYDVRVYNLKCAECGKPVLELPFQPLSSGRPVYCADCNQKRTSPKKRPYKAKPKGRRH